MQIRENWAELLEPGLRRIFDRHLGRKRDYLRTIYNVESSTKAVERTLGIGGLGLMEEWTATGNKVAYEDFNKGFVATFIHKKFSKGLAIERELVEDDQYGEIRKRVRALADVVYYTRQVHAAQPFNQAFGGLLGPDGKPLCAPDHPVAPGSNNTYSNVTDAPLSADAVEAARTAMKSWTDDKGNLLPVEPDTLIVPPALRKKALVIADSDKEPDTDLNNINVWRGALRVIEWDFLTNPNAWFLVDSSRMQQFLHWFDRRVPRLEADGENFDTEVGRWKVVGRWSYGWEDASFIYGSTGTGTA